jgi:hypothetical protein
MKEFINKDNFSILDMHEVVGFEVVTAVTMKSAVFCVVMSCSSERI